MSEKRRNFGGDGSAVNLLDVCKSFTGRCVLEGIGFHLTGGQGLCICGANAAGKTTLLRIIAGLLEPDEGQVRICGFDIKHQKQRTGAMLGAIFHKTMVYPQLTVIENLRFFARLYGVRDSKARIRELLEESSLMPYCYDSAGILSRGMMQRLAIARALVHRPAVLLADEPFAGLDAEAGKHLVTVIRKFRDTGGTVVMTTHNVSFALQCCERVAVLDDKKLIFNTEVSEINTAEFVRDYLLYARENS